VTGPCEPMVTEPRSPAPAQGEDTPARHATETAPAERTPTAPVRRPSEALPPTALKILEAAKRLLATRGYGSLTLEKIAAKAGVNKASTRYYFGNKAGLLEAIVDEIVLDECAAMTRDISPDAPLEERVGSFINGVRAVATDTSSFGGFFDILPQALRDRKLHTRLVRLYEVWYQWNLEWLALDRVEDDRRREELAAIGQLAAAIMDGIAVQASIHGRDYDPEPTLRTLRHCLLAVLR
jgi:AcrR family transcriptional regulator